MFEALEVVVTPLIPSGIFAQPLANCVALRSNAMVYVPSRNAATCFRWSWKPTESIARGSSFNGDCMPCEAYLLVLMNIRDKLRFAIFIQLPYGTALRWADVPYRAR